MFGVALLTSALLALADARIYERCELARDLLSLGISREHLATWVCIAYHESRFDTAARNPSSGDHGLLQISELYWCGAGKACGLPCSALRDEDISDDVECALRIHKEHTRLQGNGFLAWVVYPNHCKHNAKKYLADCDSSVKTPSVRTQGGARVLKSEIRNNTSFSYNPNIDKLLPPYLTIASLFRGNYEKEFEQSYNNKAKTDWLSYKIDNIDDLKLPVFNQKIGEYTTPTLSTRTTSTTTTTTTPSPLPNIKPPSPRRIESNSFRRRKLRPIEEVNLIETTVSPVKLLSTPTPRNTYRTTTENIQTQKKLLQATTPVTTPLATTPPTTSRPTTKSFDLFLPPSTVAVEQQTKKSVFPYTEIPTTATISRVASTKIRDGSSSVPTTSSTPLTYQISTTVPKNQSFFVSTNIVSTTRSSFFDLKTNAPINKSVYTKSVGSTSVSSYTTTTNTPPTAYTNNNRFSFKWSTPQTVTTTPRPWLTWRTTSNYRPTTSTVSKPSTESWRTTKTSSSATSQTNQGTSKTVSKYQSTTSNPWARTRDWLNTKKLPTEFKNNTSTTKTLVTESTTWKPYFTTPRIRSRSTAKPSVNSTTTIGKKISTGMTSPTTARTTQSIFDLYLNPTKRPSLPAFSFAPFTSRGAALKIFAGGTTTHAPSLLKGEGAKSTIDDGKKMK